MEKLLRMDEAAARLNVSQRTLSRWAAQGLVKTVERAGARRVELKELAQNAGAQAPAALPGCVTVKEAAAAAGVSEATMRRRVKAGSVGAIQPARGRAVRIPKEALQLI